MGYMVINNAGRMGGGPRNTIDLNTYGVRRVCEAFAPLIQAGGRIVQVSSGSAPMFVEKCSPEMKEFCVKQDVTWKEVLPCTTSASSERYFTDRGSPDQTVPQLVGV